MADPTIVPQHYIENAVGEIRKNLMVSRDKFGAGALPLLSGGKNVIIVDDGLATGHTLLAAVKLAKLSRPRTVTVAVPVASKSGAKLLENEADELIVPFVAADFCDVGDYYADFSQVSDDQVKTELRDFRQNSGAKNR